MSPLSEPCEPPPAAAANGEAISPFGVPASVLAHAEMPVWAAISSRLSAGGRFEPTWLLIGSSGVAVVSEADAGREVERIEWINLKAVTPEPVTNGGSLWARTVSGPMELVRYIAGDAPLFSAMAAAVNRHLNEPDESRMREEFERVIVKHRERFCSTCRSPLPRASRICRFCVPRGSTLLRILSFAKPYRVHLSGMGALMIVGTLLHLVPPQITRLLVDDVLLSPGRAGLLPMLVGILAAVMIAWTVVGIWRARVGIWVGCNVTNDIQGAAFNHLQALSLSYFNRQQTGALMARINGDARQMQGFLVEGLQYTVVNLLTILGVAGVLLWMNPFLGFLVLVPAPLVVILSVVVWRRIHRRFRLLWVSLSAISSYLNDALSGVRVIKAFGREEAERGKFRGKLERARIRTIDAEQTWQTLVPILNLIVQSSLVLVWYFGAWQVYGKKLSVGELIAYIGYLGLIFGPLQLVTRLNDWLTRSITAAARVFEILDTESEVIEKKDGVSLAACNGNLELRNVTFGYEKHQPVLRNLTLSIESGKMVGLVGKSGAGKSTLINLVGRLYDVDEGSVVLDGTDIRQIKLADLRRHIGYVLQDTFLFNGTVAENITYANPDADAEAILKAAMAANAHEFIIKLPDGYDTMVGERGTRLSGGERQRIAIARALLQDPRILILDEATSSVDTETEQKIQEALARLVEGRTTIAIAHRLSTLRHANKLIVLQDGRMVEEGTHEELMELKNGAYRKLVEIQTEWNRMMAV